MLGIDAAWTDRNPSGVALVVRDGNQWRCVRTAASYAEFLGSSAARSDRFPGAPTLLRRAGELLPAGASVTSVAIDMPLARGRIVARRPCDTMVSKRFGGAWCSVHSPTRERPGRLAQSIRDSFADEGFALATEAPARHRPHLIEVYPHVALLRLARADQRLPYKVSRIRRYWPEVAQEARVGKLIDQWRTILVLLQQVVADIGLALPPPMPRRGLKSFEDALDAVICAWVATRMVEGRAEPIGDDSAAIWIPHPT